MSYARFGPTKCRLCGLFHYNTIPCKSWAASLHSIGVTKKHVKGKYCKERNQCAKCGEIKHKVRILRHFGGVCSPKKCPVCQWDRERYEKHNVGWHEKNLYRIIKWMYQNIMSGAQRL